MSQEMPKNSMDMLRNRIWEMLDQSSQVDIDQLKREFPECADQIPTEFTETASLYEAFAELNLAAEKAADNGKTLDLEEWIRRYPALEQRIRKHFRTRFGIASTVSGPEVFELRSSDRYSIGDSIAHGGMGAIMLAVDNDFGRQTVLKVPLKNIAKDPKHLARLDREARISGLLQHPNILPVFEKGHLVSTSGEKVPYFAMPFLKGNTLAELLNQRNSPEERQFEFILLFRQICQAMAYSHSREIINRDLKPQNVMVGSYGDAYVIDWGYAKEISEEFTSVENAPKNLDQFRDDLELDATLAMEQAETQTATGMIGTWSYLPPEVTRQNSFNDKRLDVFCLGGILTCILTGKPVFIGSKPEVIRKVHEADLSETFKRLDACGGPQELIRIAKQCLDTDLAKRPQDAQELTTLVSRYVDTLQEAKVAAERRLRWVTIAIAAGILGLVTFGLLWRQIALNQARIADLRKSGEFAYGTGDHELASENLDRAIDLGGPLVPLKIKQIRSRFSRATIEELIAEAEGLRKLPMSPSEKAELDFVLGDLLCSWNEKADEGRSLLEEAIQSGKITVADKEYALAILADGIQETELHLRASIADQPFHHRANLMLVGILFARGQLTEANRTAELVKLTFPRETVLTTIIEACRVLQQEDRTINLPESDFKTRLNDLITANDEQLDDAPIQGMDHLTFRRQAEVANRISEVVESLPGVDKTLGLPKAPFGKRAELWRLVSKNANLLAPPSDHSFSGITAQLLNAAGVQTVDKGTVLKKLSELLVGEKDGLGIQTLAVTQFVELSTLYGKIDEKDFSQRMFDLANLETQSIESETLAPRSQFEFASRAIRVLSDYKSRHLSTDPDVKNGQRMRRDTKYIFATGRRYPQMLDNIAELLMKLFLPASNSSITVDNSESLSHGLEMLNDWIVARPDHAGALIHRAAVWGHLSMWDYGLSDVQQVLDKHPTHAKALAMKSFLLSNKPPISPADR